ncbi:hypothetical protein VKT23_017880 [Stygiomarasmius scandens]|uniref:Uncharacterized protein n=1 Tax=Marasmiellus scandens TaxID=2682957 RepID=A0ABR1IQT9_9AGAR
MSAFNAALVTQGQTATQNDNGQDRVIVPGFLEDIPERSEPSESNDPKPERIGFYDDADLEYVDSDNEELGNLIVKTPSETSSESESEEEEIGSNMTSGQILQPITGELVDSENDEPVQDTNESWGYPLCETPEPDWGDCVSNADDLIDHDNSYVPEWKKSCDRFRFSWPGAFGFDTKIIENDWEWKGLETYNDLATELHYISEWIGPVCFRTKSFCTAQHIEYEFYPINAYQEWEPFTVNLDKIDPSHLWKAYWKIKHYSKEQIEEMCCTDKFWNYVEAVFEGLNQSYEDYMIDLEHAKIADLVEKGEMKPNFEDPQSWGPQTPASAWFMPSPPSTGYTHNEWDDEPFRTNPEWVGKYNRVYYGPMTADKEECMRWDDGLFQDRFAYWIRQPYSDYFHCAYMAARKCQPVPTPPIMPGEFFPTNEDGSAVEPPKFTPIDHKREWVLFNWQQPSYKVDPAVTAAVEEINEEIEQALSECSSTKSDVPKFYTDAVETLPEHHYSDDDTFSLLSLLKRLLNSGLSWLTRSMVKTLGKSSKKMRNVLPKNHFLALVVLLDHQNRNTSLDQRGFLKAGTNMLK